MHTRRLFLLTTVLLIAAGCATTQESGENTQLPQIPFMQVKATPDSYRGQVVTWGGEILSARRLKEGTRIEVLQLPLNSSLQPTMELNKSQGRFVALQREFLDPATIPPGTFVTVTGEVTGSVTLPLDETEYTYPIVELKTMRVWSSMDDQPIRIRPHMGPGPNWGPYWSPYWRPWPYW